VEPTPTSSQDHVEFDRMCAGVEEFETLPEVPSPPLEREPSDEDDTSMDDQIMAGLVTP
jgi:hypothetical protein